MNLHRAFFEAIQKGDAEAAKKALDSGRLSDNDKERGFLQAAAKDFRVECMRMLLREGVDPNCVDFNADGLCALQIAAQNGAINCAKLALEEGGAGADSGFWPRAARAAKKMRGIARERTPLSLAVENGDEAMVAFLAPLSDLSAPNSEGQTALEMAVLQKNEAIARLLANAQTVADLPQRAADAFQLCATWGWGPGLEILGRFMDASRVDAEAPRGCALRLAAQSGSLPAVQAAWRAGRAFRNPERAARATIAAATTTRRVGRPTRDECAQWIGAQLPPESQGALWERLKKQIPRSELPKPAAEPEANAAQGPARGGTEADSARETACEEAAREKLAQERWPALGLAIRAREERAALQGAIAEEEARGGVGASAAQRPLAQEKPLLAAKTAEPEESAGPAIGEGRECDGAGAKPGARASRRL